MGMRATSVLVAALLVAACGGSAGSPFLAEGRDLYRDNACATCHGGNGRGGVGPALASVAETFPACADQVEWVMLGSDGWRAAYGDTYGATDRPVKGGMRAFAEDMTADEVRRVVAYVRIEFGGLDEAAVRADCGL